MEKTVRVVMAGGGTGGHLYPGLAVAEALENRFIRQAPDGNPGPALEILWAATPRAVDQRLLSGFGERYIRQMVKPLLLSPGKWWGFWRSWRETCGYWKRYFARSTVDCVVALGGYAAGPAAYVAGKRGIAVILLNPDVLPGRANRFLFKRADVIVTQWPMDIARGAGAELMRRIKPLGCPIRRELFGRSRAEGAGRLGVDADKKTLVITGASLGAKTINEALIALLGDAEFRRAFEAGGTESAGGWQLLHLAGTEQATEVRTVYEKYPRVRAKVMDYCDDMASVWAVADLAIARAGASTCAELTACGVPALLLPYPFHKDMHQRANAMELANGGAAVVIEDAKDPRKNAAAIKTELQLLLYDDSRRGAMRQAARKLGKPAAADRIANEIFAAIARSSR